MTQKAPYKKGDFIGQRYEVYDVLGMGGFGIVYLVYSHEYKGVYALKTFRDEYLEDIATRERFKKEAQIWINLERHPYLVRAYFVDEIASRLYIVMKHIAPDEQGLNTLDGYLRRRPPDLAQSLRWAIQFCHGMEYAYSKGIKAHRDIKPANILIDQNKTIKISDFGLAGVIGTARITSGIKLDIQKGNVGLSCQTMEGTGFGTPTHMPPEQFTNAASCDERSDIYSFGVVLYQMASGGKLPFLPDLPRDSSDKESMRFWQEIYRLHCQSPVPKINSPLFPIIFRCLEKNPIDRFFSFKELRADIEPLLKLETGETIKVPESAPFSKSEWVIKGFSLFKLNKPEEAITCCDNALEIDLMDYEAWSLKGDAFNRLEKYQEAINCYDKALEIYPKGAASWTGKGNALSGLEKYHEAIDYFNEALKINPKESGAWFGKGSVLYSLGEYHEAITCYDKLLDIDPSYIYSFSLKGIALQKIGKHDEALVCYNKFLELNPLNDFVWSRKGLALSELGRNSEAINSYDTALKINPVNKDVWFIKGTYFGDKQNYEEAIVCYDRVLEIEPHHFGAWYNKGFALLNLGMHQDTITCYNKVLEIEPQNAVAWHNKGESFKAIGMYKEAIEAYKNFIRFVTPKHAAHVEKVKEIIKQLET